MSRNRLRVTRRRPTSGSKGTIFIWPNGTRRRWRSTTKAFATRRPVPISWPWDTQIGRRFTSSRGSTSLRCSTSACPEPLLSGETDGEAGHEGEELPKENRRRSREGQRALSTVGH
uniref:(northern house mosquito) hypothetical protein n=1 Tax=Culex pipiens TaxID=7175 RepID=A0A8D8KGR4_CULPI